MADSSLYPGEGKELVNHESQEAHCCLRTSQGQGGPGKASLCPSLPCRSFSGPLAYLSPSCHCYMPGFLAALVPSPQDPLPSLPRERLSKPLISIKTGHEWQVAARDNNAGTFSTASRWRPQAPSPSPTACCWLSWGSITPRRDIDVPAGAGIVVCVKCRAAWHLQPQSPLDCSPVPSRLSSELPWMASGSTVV